MKIRIKNLSIDEIDKIITKLQKAKEQATLENKFTQLRDLENQFQEKLIELFEQWEEETIDKLNALQGKSFDIPRYKHTERTELKQIRGYVFHKYTFSAKLKKLNPNFVDSIVQLRSGTLKELIDEYVEKAFKRGAKQAIKDLPAPRKVKKGGDEDLPGTYWGDQWINTTPNKETAKWLRANSLLVSQNIASDISGKLKSQILQGILANERITKIRDRIRRVFNEQKVVAKELKSAIKRRGITTGVREVVQRYGGTKTLVRVIQEGVREGKKVEDLLAETKLVGNMVKNRARMIAITETNRAANLAKLQSYKDSDAVRFVEIIVAADERTCEECLTLQGQKLTLDEAQNILPVHPLCRCTWAPVIRGVPRPEYEIATDYEKGVDYITKSEVTRALANMPNDVQKNVRRVRIHKNEPSAVQVGKFKGVPKGVYHKSIKEIELYPSFEPKETLYHELGHAFENSDRLSTWAPIAAKEKAKMFSAYHKSFIAEDFAETFKLYHVRPKALKVVQPLRYNAMKKFLDEASKFFEVALTKNDKSFRKDIILLDIKFNVTTDEDTAIYVMERRTNPSNNTTTGETIYEIKR